ncbi:MAG: hypothetical protein ACRD5H_16715 [Nitrososphaerales archaeon]
MFKKYRHLQTFYTKRVMPDKFLDFAGVTTASIAFAPAITSRITVAPGASAASAAALVNQRARRAFVAAEPRKPNEKKCLSWSGWFP